MRVLARLAGLAVGVGLIAFFLAVPALPLALAPPERLSNGNFEDGFAPDGVALGWQPFGWGESHLTWSAEREEPAVWDGAGAQRLTIQANGEPAGIEEYVGIYQTVDVVAGETYQLTAHGAAHVDASASGIAIQWGVNLRGGASWRTVDEWVDFPWTPANGAAALGALHAYATTLTATTPRLTLFLRARKPPAVPVRQLDLILDGLSLRGSRPAPEAGIAGFKGPVVSISAPAFPVIGGETLLRVDATHPAGVSEVRLFADGVEIGRIAPAAPATVLERSFTWMAETAGAHQLRAEARDAGGSVGMAWHAVTVGAVGELLRDGTFADAGVAWQTVAAGGQATWGPAGRLRLAGAGRPLPGAACYAGIYQEIDGLRAGATYDLHLAGRLGAAQPAERWRAEYALAWTEARAALKAPAELDWRALPWPADEGQPPSYFAATVVAEAGHAMLLVRARRLWGASACEMELVLTFASLTGYR